MQFSVYTKDIKTGAVSTSARTVEIDGKPHTFANHMAVAEAIKNKLGIISGVKSVASLKTGKNDLCFEVQGKDNKSVRYMCYSIETVAVKTEVSMRRVADMLVGAFEGGSNYWARSVKYLGFPVAKGVIWYDCPELLQAAGALFEIRYDDPAKEEGNGEGYKQIDGGALVAGLMLMAKNSPRHFADLVNDNDDNTTQDVYLQYVVLGEVVYG